MSVFDITPPSSLISGIPGIRELGRTNPKVDNEREGDPDFFGN
jgi:hypothetical protein